MSNDPPRNLPPELFGRIFRDCLPEKDTDRLDPNQIPMVLCRVDSHWRQAAFTEHALWDTIIFTTSRASTKKYAKFITAGHVDTWFGRTGDRSLSFGEEPCYRSPHGSLLSKHLISLVNKYSTRFRHLSIVFYKLIHFEWFRRGFPQDIYPRLSSVSISCTMEMNTSVQYGFPSLATTFSTTRRLQDVSLTLLRASPKHFTLPWESLTRIVVCNPLRPMTGPEWSDLFKTCPNVVEAMLVRPDSLYPNLTRVRTSQVWRHDALRRLILVIPGVQEHHLRRQTRDWSILANPVVFPSLVRLELRFEQERCRSGSLMDYVDTPTLSSLETLVLTSGRDGEELQEAQELVLKMIEMPRAFTALTTIELPYPSSHFREIVDVLRDHPPSTASSPEPYPGLAIHIKVLPGRWEYDKWVEVKKAAQRDDEPFSRLYLT